MSLEMLTEAADLVETQDMQKRRMESPDPEAERKKALFSNHVSESSVHKGHETNGNVENCINGTTENRRHGHTTTNGSSGDTPKESLDARSTRTAKIHDQNGSKDDTKAPKEISVDVENRTTVQLSDPAQQLLYQRRLAEQTNGKHTRDEKASSTEDDPSARRLSASLRQSKSSSPAVDKGGDTHPATKPMVLLQQPSSSTLSSVGSSHAVPLTNPAMHHPYLYPMMYPAASVAALDPALGALGRAPGNALKDGEGHTLSPNGSPNAGLPSGLQFPAGLMYPFANQALLMGARPPGTVTDLSQLLLAQSSAGYPMFDQYKRFLEGMPQFPPAYSLHPQLADQYLKSLAGHGLDGGKDAMALNAMAGGLPLGVSLAALQGQPGTAESWLRYQDQPAATMGMLRPQSGISPRSGSPYAGKQRTDSPAFVNGGKIPGSYPFHGGLGQPQLNSLAEAARSPATSMYSQGHRPRSAEAERLPFRLHSRDVEREAAPTAKELTTRNHTRTSNEHLAPPSYSVTDPQTGRKISLPSFYDIFNHVPPGHPLGMAVRSPAHGRSPSPRSRQREDRSYRRRSNDRSPAEMQPKRRSLESEYAARNSPNVGERHSSRPMSPTTNGHPTSRPQLPHVNGSSNAELAKARQHTLLSSDLARYSNPAGFAATEGREPRSGSPFAGNPPYHAAVVPPYLAPHILDGLAGTSGSPLMLPPQYTQALAASTKGTDLALFYKPGENVSEYGRAAGLPPPLSTIFAQQQQLLASSRPPALSHDYATALKAHPYYLSPSGANEGGKPSQASARDKVPGLPQQIHQSFLAQHPPQARSPAKIPVKPKHHSASPHVAKPAHFSRDSHSPPGIIASSAEARLHHSPGADRPGFESPPKHSNKPYRPNSMLRQHAEDLERRRKRKMLEEERVMREDGGAFALDRRAMPRIPDRKESETVKDEAKDAKRRKQLISEADPEDHFRRALGKDYIPTTSNKVHVSGSVDDHFKKALGSMYENIQVAPKSEARDAAQGLPSYSAAVAFVTQSPRIYPPPHHPDGKEPIASRLYDPAYLARERYCIPSLGGSLPRKLEQSPPRGAPPTVRSSPNPSIGPVRQKVKARAFIPEALAVPPDLRNGHLARMTSLASKVSSKIVGDNGIGSLPAAEVASGSPTSSAVVSEAASLPPVVSVPYSIAHQQNMAAIATSRMAAGGVGGPPREKSASSSPSCGSPQKEATEKPNSPQGSKEAKNLSPGK